ncbi:MAG: hypothetical protein A2W52_03365 [Candidatus Taylorbacteria bacterium RIFCSPHIGHO2_02_49_25]|uniref:AtpZ/AtpI family protein n=1 Tax=Candidatus Taylorbacteria bacterium RIFCSPHIGHO2_02_49_25 TaxID=1802305 RepID=A0A1G2MDW1_9BACT|nr:MAG: hypothetical protein A2W52_03365 [Candidatus Taylorbacteria bacterium RIFCSPHIGHO2_02_49_25]
MQEGEEKSNSTNAQFARDTAPQRNPPGGWQLYGLAFEVGYTVAIPLVLFAWGGRYADKTLQTSPWFLLGGIIISIFISSVLVYRKISPILKSQTTNPKSQTNPGEKNHKI